MLWSYDFLFRLFFCLIIYILGVLCGLLLRKTIAIHTVDIISGMVGGCLIFFSALNILPHSMNESTFLVWGFVIFVSILSSIYMENNGRFIFIIALALGISMHFTFNPNRILSAIAIIVIWSILFSADTAKRLSLTKVILCGVLFSAAFIFQEYFYTLGSGITSSFCGCVLLYCGCGLALPERDAWDNNRIRAFCALCGFLISSFLI